MSYTPPEIHIHIEQGLQKINSYVLDEYEPEEIDLFYNKMRTRFIKSRYDKWYDAKHRGFESSSKFLADIQKLVTTETVSNIGLSEDTKWAEISMPQGAEYDPKPYLYYISANANLIDTLDGCPVLVADIPVVIMEHEELNALKQDPFVVNLEQLPAVMENDVLRMYVGERFILQDVTVTYIFAPDPVDITSYSEDNPTGVDVLPEVVQDEIIDMVIKHMLEIEEAKRYQTKAVEDANAN